MSWKEVIGAVAEEFPKFNDEILINFKKREIGKCADYMEAVFIEVVRAIASKIDIKYLRYEVEDPVTEVRNFLSQKETKNRHNIARSEWQLTTYYFEIEGEQFSISLNVPYWKDHGLFLDGREYTVQLVVGDKLARIPEGIILKVMRSPLKFWRSDKNRLIIKDIHNQTYPGHVITVKAHYGAKAKNVRPSVLLYILAKYDFARTMEMLNCKGLIDIVQTCDYEDEYYTYFEILENKCYIKASMDELASSVIFKRVVISVYDILTTFKDDLTSEDFVFKDLWGTNFYTGCLGKLLYGKQNTTGLARSHGVEHLKSLDQYLDALSRAELKKMNVSVNDVYELFVYVFNYIDNWLANYQPNDLFDKKICGVNHLFRQAVITIFKKVYPATEKSNIKAKDVISGLRFGANLLNCITKAEGITNAHAAYNDDCLISNYTDKLRQSRDTNGKPTGKKNNLITSKEHRFSPSFVAIESVLSISTSSPGIAGRINPYAQIEPTGEFSRKKMPWCEQIEGLNDYLL